jgi:hypothetical protein
MELATQYVLVIVTAREIGITIPRKVLLRAVELIE